MTKVVAIDSKSQPDLEVGIPLQDASLDIWDKKYRLKSREGEAVDPSLDSTFQRVARALADVEETEENKSHWYGKFLWALRQGAIPAGRIISNAGAREHKPATSTINCTVSGTVGDSMDDILGKVHEAGLTLKAGCGIGYDFSTLRPRGAYVSGAGAYTSGPLSFMDIYDKMCFTVSSAGGRRGAQMATFDVRHPDVFEFIRAKREDGRLRQFNLSLLITEDFINAVRNDQPWQLAFPVQQKEIEKGEVDVKDTEQVIWLDWPSKDGMILNDEGLVACKIYRTVKAIRLWEAIMASTYDFAEPGFILIDKVNEQNNNWFCEEIRATNPCVTADTWVQTSEGPAQVAELTGTPFKARVDGEDHATGPQGFFKTATKEVVKLQTREGHSLRLTSDHRVRKVINYTRNQTQTQWCEAGELQSGDRVLLNNHRGQASWQGKTVTTHGSDEGNGYLLGLLLGDGTIKQDKTVLSVWAESPLQNVANGDYICDNTPQTHASAIMQHALTHAQALPHRADFNGWMPVPGRNEFRLSTAAIGKLANDYGMAVGNKTITTKIESGSSDFYCGFLRGLFDADGSVQGSTSKGISVRLAQSDLPVLEAAQRMLLRLGIASSLYKNRRNAGSSVLPDGKGGVAEYATKAQHELVISGDNLHQYQAQIGFADTAKSEKLRQLLNSYQRTPNRERFTAVVQSVKPCGTEDVYDVQVPGINTFCGNGLHAHNCGEQPLPPYGACLLGSVNLTRFVTKPFTSEASFDWDKYRDTVEVFTRMLDNVVEINGLPLFKQREEIQYKRRHGMGYLGLGSAITMMQMKYGSEDSLVFTEKVTREMALSGWKTGVALAQEKGPAPIMDDEFTLTTDMIRKRPELKKDGYKPGDKIKGKVLLGKYSRYMQQLATVDKTVTDAIAEHGCRFTHHTSIAPTGTISLSLANNASNGIEPSFAHHYARNVIREGKKSKEKVDVYSYELLAYRELVNMEAMPYATEEENQLPEYFLSADDITPTQHVDVQAAAQKWIDSSISKTANVPTDFAYEEFKDIYLYAHEKGLKGCTTFRFNPEAFQGVLVKESDLENTTYEFALEDGSTITCKGNEEIEYDGELHTAANLYDALKEGYYGKF